MTFSLLLSSWSIRADRYFWLFCTEKAMLINIRSTHFYELDEFSGMGAGFDLDSLEFFPFSIISKSWTNTSFSYFSYTSIDISFLAVVEIKFISVLKYWYGDSAFKSIRIPFPIIEFTVFWAGVLRSFNSFFNLFCLNETSRRLQSSIISFFSFEDSLVRCWPMFRFFYRFPSRVIYFIFDDDLLLNCFHRNPVQVGIGAIRYSKSVNYFPFTQ